MHKLLPVKILTTMLRIAHWSRRWNFKSLPDNIERGQEGPYSCCATCQSTKSRDEALILKLSKWLHSFNPWSRIFHLAVLIFHCCRHLTLQVGEKEKVGAIVQEKFLLCQRHQLNLSTELYIESHKLQDISSQQLLKSARDFSLSPVDIKVTIQIIPASLTMYFTDIGWISVQILL